MSRSVTTLEARPPAFNYREVRHGLLRRKTGAVLCCEEVPVPRLAERFGTPLYIYSASAIRERMRIFQHAFRRAAHTICYSVKANSNLSILRLLAEMDCGFDVVSGGELERVLRVDKHAARKIVFSGVGKTREEMRLALKAGILLFNVESESELWTLAECAGQMRTQARIAFRVNPDVPANTHPYISTGLQKHKFGVPIQQARELYAKASSTRHLRVEGVSVHIGSQITDMEPFSDTMEHVVDLIDELRDDGHEINFVDAGGGLGIAYDPSGKGPGVADRGNGREFSRAERSQPPSTELFFEYVSRYAEALLKPLRGMNVHLLLEPGRSIVGPAGALITAVLYRKTNHSKNFLIADAGMNDLVRPSLYNAFHEIIAVELQDKNITHEVVDIVGPVCETGDFFARDRVLPRVEEGDWLAILDTGAYGLALASHYNTRPHPAEVLVDGKSAKVIRRRETAKDLMRGE